MQTLMLKQVQHDCLGFSCLLEILPELHLLLTDSNKVGFLRLQLLRKEYIAEG